MPRNPAGLNPGPPSLHAAPPRAWLAAASSGARVILRAGALAGVLDLSYVLVLYVPRGASALKILQSIAAGLLGREAAYQGGWATALLGLACHFLIAFCAAAVFYAASRRIASFVRHAIAAGLLYGVAVWLVMNLVVLPLSALPRVPFPPANWLPILVAHRLCIGLPIAIFTRRYSVPR